MTITIPNSLPMIWVKALNRNRCKIFPFLGWRLLLIYTAAMTAIFGTSAAVLYVFFSRSLNQQLNDHLLTLVQTAVPSLDAVKTQGRQGSERDLPRRHLFSRREQSLEWYSADGELLAREGTVFPKFPLVRSVSPPGLKENFPAFQQQDQTRTVTIPVYADEPEENRPQLKGYIRASESTEHLQMTLHQLQVGLGLEAVTALMLASLSGTYLTQQALEPIKQTCQQLKQFTTEISHQLRNPLTRIGMATDLLLYHREQMQPSDVRKLEMIDTAAARIQHAVEDLLFLVRTDAAGASISFEQSTVPLDQLLRTLAGKFDSQAQIKGITFQARLPTSLSVKGDAIQLSRLFSNLLENALQYTEAGGSVTLSWEQSKRSAVVWVKDTGIGIATEHLPLVFERFWRSEQAQSQQPQGLGLGLTIAQAIARGHGGEITVSSKVGEGSCFQVRLPLV